MTTPARLLAGEMLVAGLEGPALTGLERAWLALVRPAGIILFRRNIEDAAQTRALLREAGALASGPRLALVDLEGGLVDRLRDAIAPLPSALAVASTGSARLMRRHGELIGAAAALAGFNTVLAPVVDLRLPESAAVMGTRTVSADPDATAAYARCVLTGMARHRVAGCLKHFPGLGAGTLDSHQATPFIARTLEQLLEADLVPYRLLAREAPLVMVSHAAFPLTRGGRSPASVSRYWITEVLRGRLGYRGLVISDDMEMGGLLSQMPIAEAAVAAVLAGTDLVEICHSAERVLLAYEALLREAERSGAFRRLLRASQQRRRRAGKFFAGARRRAAGGRELGRLRREIAAFAGEVERMQP
jgi:beta-N-acetylhexosaminidase